MMPGCVMTVNGLRVWFLGHHAGRGQQEGEDEEYDDAEEAEDSTILPLGHPVPLLALDLPPACDHQCNQRPVPGMSSAMTCDCVCRLMPILWKSPCMLPLSRRPFLDSQPPPPPPYSSPSDPSLHVLSLSLPLAVQDSAHYSLYFLSQDPFSSKASRRRSKLLHKKVICSLWILVPFRHLSHLRHLPPAPEKIEIWRLIDCDL
jgi:hypothetical protein